MEWFRWYHGTVNDPKFTVIARAAGAPKMLVLAVWGAVLECASLAEPRGCLDAFDCEDVAAGLDVETELVESVYGAMVRKDMITDGCVVASWDKRQPKREDDGAAERKRGQREREKLKQENEELRRRLDELSQASGMSRNVTHGHARSQSVTQCHARLEEKRGDDIREETAGSTSSGLSSNQQKSYSACGNVDNFSGEAGKLPEGLDISVLEGQKRLVENRKALGEGKAVRPRSRARPP